MLFLCFCWPFLMVKMWLLKFQASQLNSRQEEEKKRAAEFLFWKRKNIPRNLQQMSYWHACVTRSLVYTREAGRANQFWSGGKQGRKKEMKKWQLSKPIHSVHHSCASGWIQCFTYSFSGWILSISVLWARCCRGLVSKIRLRWWFTWWGLHMSGCRGLWE